MRSKVELHKMTAEEYRFFVSKVIEIFKGQTLELMTEVLETARNEAQRRSIIT